MADTIISGAIFGICAVIMFGIGFTQYRSKRPVGFYSGETPPREDELTDVRAWNQKHGMMWMGYGACMVLAWVVGLFIGDSILAVVPYIAGLLLPIVLMVIYHHKLVKQYRISGKEQQ